MLFWLTLASTLTIASCSTSHDAVAQSSQASVISKSHEILVYGHTKGKIDDIQWTNEYIRQLQDAPVGTQSFALLSYGGWGNHGQIMAFWREKDGRLQFVLPNRNVSDLKEALKAKRHQQDGEVNWILRKKATKNPLHRRIRGEVSLEPDLEDVVDLVTDPEMLQLNPRDVEGFDLKQFEYIVAERTSKGVHIKQRVFMEHLDYTRNADGSLKTKNPDQKNHVRLISTLQGLVRKLTGNKHFG